MLMEQNMVMTSTKKIRPRPPPGVPITMWKTYGKAWALGALAIISASGGKVAQIGITKNKPAMPPTGMHRLIARGTLIVGSLHSSAMLVIMPIAEKVYAAGKRPMKNVKPPHPDSEVS
jgi:hypothetical protein